MAEHPSRDDLVAFALGAIEPREGEAVDRHIPGCAACTRELEAISPAVGVLGESVDQLVPPPEMRDRVLAIVNSEAEAREVTEPALRPRPRLARLLLRPAAALTAAAVIAAGVSGYLLAGDGGDGATTVPVMAEAGIGGTLAVEDDSATLELQGMDRLAGSQVYQVWVAKGTELRPSSSFIPEQDGTATTGVDGHLDPGTRVMVTREPRAGRTTPTPPILLSATVQ
jgi:Anti-sigma-K factor rskA